MKYMLLSEVGSMNRSRYSSAFALVSVVRDLTPVALVYSLLSILM